MSFSIDPSNSDQSIKETNKDMNNQKIINPYNPTDHQVKVTKMLMKKQKIDSLLCQNMPPEIFSLRHSSR